MNKLPFKETLSEACQIGFKNILSLIAVTLLYIVTIWVPYINIGTTLAMNALPAELAKGHVIDPFFIFGSKYRKNMGEYLILGFIEFTVVIIALCALVVPAFVLGLSWSLAVLLFVDKNMKPLDALRESNELTYGYKWRIFGLVFVLSVCLAIVDGIVVGICAAADLTTLGAILNGIISLLFVPFALGLDAVIYRNLTREEEPKEEEPKEESKAEVVVEEVIVTEE